MCKQNVVEHNYVEPTPKAFLKESNLDVSKALVKLSTSWFSVSMHSKDIVSKSCMKWCLISMYLFLECWIGFLEILIALVYHKIL